MPIQPSLPHSALLKSISIHSLHPLPDPPSHTWTWSFSPTQIFLPHTQTQTVAGTPSASAAGLPAGERERASQVIPTHYQLINWAGKYSEMKVHNSLLLLTPPLLLLTKRSMNSTLFPPVLLLLHSRSLSPIREPCSSCSKRPTLKGGGVVAILPKEAIRIAIWGSFLGS